MRRLATLALALAACGGDDAPAPGCHLTVADLRAPTAANRACIDTLFATDRPRAAQLLGQLDWEHWKDTSKTLDALKLDARTWYLVAQEPSVVPRAALTGLQTARPTADQSFAADLDLAMIRLATRIGDESTTNTAIQSLLASKALVGAQKLELLELLAKRSDQEHIERVCSHAAEPAIAWRCIELAPNVPQSLEACARLPVLSYRDIEKLAPLKDKLPGLRCLDEGPRGPRWVFARFENKAPPAAEVTLYARLALDAPSPEDRCLLEEASRGCVHLIRDRGACPVPDVIARYLAISPEQDRAAVFSMLVGGKNLTYVDLDNGSKDAARALFYFHVVLGEILVANPNMFPSPSSPVQIASYHMIRAYQFWNDAKDETLTFADMTTPAFRDAVCANQRCTGSCASACANFPTSVCRVNETLQAEICNSSGPP